MFSGVRSFFYRHRRKFLWTGLIAGGVYLTWQWTRKTLREMRDRELKELFDRTKKEQHYESVERTCNITVLSLIPKLKDTVSNLNNTDELVKELSDGHRNKIEVWNDLKIVAFSKVTALIYLSSMLVVTLKVQLSIIGGYMFKDESKTEISNALKEKYLSAPFEHLLNDGVARLSELIQEKVRLVLKDKSLKESLSIKDLEQIFWSINSLISHDSRNPCMKLTSYMIPDEELSLCLEERELYRKVMAETCDLLESDEVVSITSSNISRGFSFVMDSMSDYFIDRSPAAVACNSKTPDEFFAANITNGGNDVSIRHISIPLAKIIPILRRLVVNGECKTDTAYEWTKQLVLMDNLKSLGANIYESFAV